MLLLLSCSLFLVPVVLLCYVGLRYRRWEGDKEEKRKKEENKLKKKEKKIDK